MPQYKVTLRVRGKVVFRVEADSADAACSKAEEMFEDGDDGEGDLYANESEVELDE